MDTQSHEASFDEHNTLHRLKHLLPAQAPLKDFVHHNTLHAFQEKSFHEGIQQASEILGYKVYLTIEEFRQLYQEGKIAPKILAKVIIKRKGIEQLEPMLESLLHQQFAVRPKPRVGKVKSHWKSGFKIDLDSLVHPLLFRLLCSYLDQGISIWRFPAKDMGFLASIRELEKNSFSSIFKSKRVKALLFDPQTNITQLLNILVGQEALFEHYLFDQQFSHPGWSGMVSAIEDQPETLLDRRKISLEDLIIFESLLEIDALDQHFSEEWLPLETEIGSLSETLFAPIPKTPLNEALEIWQEAYEWTYYDQVLGAVQKQKSKKNLTEDSSFQAMFCIDDRECSVRRHLEAVDTRCETYGTPGFFGVEFFYQPEDGKFYTKVCPTPVTPKYLIKEVGSTSVREKDAHFSKHSHSFHGGWLISQTLGYWSAFKLAASIFRPSITPAAASSFKHMDRFSKLTVENQSKDHVENGLQVGFTVDEMVVRVEAVLRSIGLLNHFAPIIYMIGHGSSSVNNPHYAAYDCGACSGRAGSVNGRVFSFMANHHAVRMHLAEKGILIPETTQFIGGLHDTARDEVVFYDEATLSPKNLAAHQNHVLAFNQALENNAVERSRRFESINTELPAAKVHEKIRLRTVSLFEPRPELNHATNALTIIGRRDLTRHLFLDRRAFLNSYDYATDPDGTYLTNILKAAAPVCGGINLEYYFSRVDNQKLGAGTKLPHNVMGLFGVANGIDGDLRPGLPSQMIEIHDPIRMLFIIEQYPEVLLKTIQRIDATYEWYINEWVNLVAIHPENQALYVFKDGGFTPYKSYTETLDEAKNLSQLFQSSQDNLPVLSLT